MMASSSQGYQVGEPGACTNATCPPSREAESAPAILHLPAGVAHGRLPPAPELGWLVEHYWWVRWDVEAPARSEVLSYPSIHLVFEAGAARIVGVVREKFVRELVGRGEVFGVKLRPAMLHALASTPAWRLTDRTAPLDGALGDAQLVAAVAGARSALERRHLVERVLTDLGPKPVPRALLASELVECIRSEGALSSVAALARRSGLSERALQRLFREFVGVSPKWVVRRFRLQDAAALLRNPETTVTSVAAKLGYFDQAHFVHDWSSVVGSTPGSFAQSARRIRS